MEEPVNRRAEISARLVQASGSIRQAQRLQFEYRLVLRIIKLCRLDRHRLPEEWTLRTLQEVYRLPVYLIAAQWPLERNRRDILALLTNPQRSVIMSEWEKAQTIVPAGEEHGVVWQVYRAPGHELVLYNQGKQLKDVHREAVYFPYRGSIFCLTRLEAVVNADAVTLR